MSMIAGRAINNPHMTDQRSDLHLDRFIPMMICRMILSLKKAAAEQPSCTSAGVGLPVDTNSYSSRRPTDSIQLAELAD